MPFWGWMLFIAFFWVMLLVSLVMGWIFHTGRHLEKQFRHEDASYHPDPSPRPDEYDRSPIV